MFYLYLVQKNILKLLNEFKRILKPKGKIIIDINDLTQNFQRYENDK